MKLTLEKYVKYLMYASFFTPLFFTPAIWTRVIFPFVVPKVVLFRSLVLLMLGCYLVLLWSDYKKYRVQNTAITVSILLFLGSFALSTFLGVDWYKSLWDNHERMLGFFTLFHYGLYYIIASVIVRQWSDWKQLLRWFFVIGSIVIALGAWQKFVNLDFLLNQQNARVSATLGNAIYFAGYGLFLGYLGLILYFQEKKGWWRNSVLFLSIFDFSGIIMSHTKGTLLGLLVSIALLFVLYFFHYKKDPKKARLWTILLLVAILSTLLLVVFRKTHFVSNIPGIGQILNTDFFTDTGSTRLMAWKIAFEGWKEHPIFGWGPNNYYYAFNKHYLPEFLSHGWGETWFDNAHNELMNTLAVQGLVGLVFYVGLLVVPVTLLTKRYRAGKLNVHLAFLSIGFLVAHFIHNIFVFEDPTSYLYFFFFLAFVNFITTQDVSFADEKKKEPHMEVPFVRLASVVLVIFFLIYRTDIDVMRANMATFSALQSIYSGIDTMKKYEYAVSIPTPHVDDVRNDVARSVETALPKYNEAKRLNDIKPLFDASIENMKKNLILHPLDIRVHMQAAQLLQLGAQYYHDPQYVQQADVLLAEALQYSPKRQQIQYMLAMLDFQLGNVTRAQQLLQDSINNLPKIQDGWWRLAFVDAASGDIVKAQQVLADAEKRGITIDPERKNYIQQVITQVKQNSKAPASK